MTVRARSNTSVELPVNGVWVIDVRVLDNDGCGAVDEAPVVTVILPSGGTATPTVEHVSTGLYRVAYVVGTVGRYVARAVTTTHGAADFTAYVTVTVAGTAMPDVAALRDYIGPGSYTDEKLQDALDAEAAAQRAVCRVPANYPADLRQALLRRAQRNLAMRQQTLAMLLPGDEGGDASVIPGRDPEVRRFEAPYRKLVIG